MSPPRSEVETPYENLGINALETKAFVFRSYWYLYHEASKVHFSTDVSLNTEINIVCKNNEEIDVHIGLLQEHHTYEIQFQVPNRFPDGWKHPEVLDSEFRILSIDSIDKNRLLVTVEWRCTMEGKSKKRLTLHSRDGAKHMKICIDARVMGKTKGTPMLKNGIKCIHVPDDTVSESSDWQGFD
eukprot:gene12367-3023_t